MARHQPLFISLRWRLLFPLALVVMLIAMLGAYVVASSLTATTASVEDRLAQQSIQAALAQLADRFVSQRNEAARMAYTSGVEAAIRAEDGSALLPLLEAQLELAELDSVSVVNRAMNEVIGVRRAADGTYAISANTAMSDETLVQRLLAGSDAEAAFVEMPEGLQLVVGVPIIAADGSVVGAGLVGQRASDFALTLQTSTLADVVLLTSDNRLAAWTLTVTPSEAERTALAATASLARDQAVLTSLSWQGTLYRAAAAPLVYGQTRLGTMLLTVPNNLPLAGDGGRQMISALAAAVAAGAVISLMAGLHRTTQRLSVITRTAQAVTRGDGRARTRMQPSDEVGAVGAALDVMADAALHREDQLRDLLTRERREHAYLFSVLEALPQGVMVYDNAGNMLLLNAQARTLLDGKPFALRPLTSQARGSALAPGIYTVGDPQQIQQGSRMLEAQAAIVLSAAQETIGTVVLLRDISAEVQRVQRQTLLLEQMQQDVEQPLYNTIASQRPPVSVSGDFAREIARHAAALQTMIVDMQALTHYGVSQARRRQRVLSVETLVWAVANDWRQIARSANLTLQVTIQRKGLLILGDESRLRLALGNLVDNAIKYTPAGGLVTLEIEREADDFAVLRVRDNGVGISDTDLKQLFIPFYRGTPMDEMGQMVRVPGMGQGLTITRQILDVHGGRIKVKSRAGAGTAVYLSLPLTAGVAGHLPLGEPLLQEGDTVMISRAEGRL